MGNTLAPDCPITSFVRALKKTKALRGVEIIPGAMGQARQTAPGRIVIWPADGEATQASDLTVSIIDVDQQLVVELWAKGSSSGSSDEATFADWNVAWLLYVKFMQALVEQGENPDPTSVDAPVPGVFWKALTGPSWNTDADTNQQGTSIKVLCGAICPVPAAPDDEGHVGDSWTQGGPVASVSITGAP